MTAVRPAIAALVVVALAVVALAAGACGREETPDAVRDGSGWTGPPDTSSLDDSGEPLEPVAPDVFAREYRAALCALVTRCGLRDARTVGDPCGPPALPRLGTHEPMPDDLTVDAADATRCIAELDAFVCDGRFVPEATLARCERAVVGLLETAASCDHDTECAGWALCTAVEGRCVCQPRAPAHWPTGLVGDTCIDDTTCLSGRCADGACAEPEPVEPGEPGQPCGVHADTVYVDPCGPGLYCPSDEDGFCQLLTRNLTAGAACDSGRTCAPELVCIEGRCATPRSEGQPCTRSAECTRALHCAEGLCQPRTPDGEVCDLPPFAFDDGLMTDACLSGSCVQGICGQTTFCGP